jgi:hypothetical protein
MNGTGLSAGLNLPLCAHPGVGYTWAEHEAWNRGEGPGVEHKCGPLCPLSLRRLDKPPVGLRDGWIPGSALYYFWAGERGPGDEWTFCCLWGGECQHKSKERITLKRAYHNRESIPPGRYGLCVFSADESFTPANMTGVNLKACRLDNVEAIDAECVGVAEYHHREDLVDLGEGRKAKVTIALTKDRDGKISEDAVGAEMIAGGAE